jgi:hypothetical protein
MGRLTLIKQLLEYGLSEMKLGLSMVWNALGRMGGGNDD